MRQPHELIHVSATDRTETAPDTVLLTSTSLSWCWQCGALRTIRESRTAYQGRIVERSRTVDTEWRKVGTATVSAREPPCKSAKKQPAKKQAPTKARQAK